MLKNRRTDFLIIINVCKLSNQLLQTMPFADFLRQNILCSSWYLIVHFVSSYTCMLPPASGWNKIKTRHQQRTSGTRYHLISLLQSAAYPLTQATIIHFLIIPPKCPILLLIVETFTRRFLSALHFTKSLFFIGCTYSVLISSFFVNRKFTFLKRRSH